MADEAKKVLVVDDEPDITFIVEYILKYGGLEVSMLNDSTLAHDELKSGNYALLILDLMMPRQDGFTLLKAIRNEESLKDLPVLILSTRQLTVDETDLIKSLGAQTTAKPFEPQRLLEKAREMLAD